MRALASNPEDGLVAFVNGLAVTTTILCVASVEPVSWTFWLAACLWPLNVIYYVQAIRRLIAARDDDPHYRTITPRRLVAEMAAGCEFVLLVGPSSTRPVPIKGVSSQTCRAASRRPAFSGGRRS